MLAPRTSLLLLGAAAAVGALAAAFVIRQNAGAMGGRMSAPKALWLSWAVLAWFFVAPLLAADAGVAPPLRKVLAVFGAWMWVRGVAELLLLYVFKAWKPPIGIAHDVTCIAILAAGLLLARGPFEGFDRWVYAFVAVLIASLCVEIAYAALFHGAVHGNTTGDGGLWFADAHDPRFLFINRLTTFFNVPLYAFLVAFLAFAGWSGLAARA